MALTRRRGEELENALLAAAWAELEAVGYSALTYDAVAARAETSKPVLYRRWPAKPDLVLAALRHAGLFADRRPLPDTGTLRGDAIESLHNFNETRANFVTAISVYMANITADSGISPAEMRDRMLGGRTTGARVLLARAADRGEIPRRDWSDTVMTLPFDLFRHDLILTLKRVPEKRIIEIVDEVWLPLVGRAS